MEDSDALCIIRKRLQPGETLVWYGVPDPWRAAAVKCAFLALFTVWTALVFSGAEVRNTKVSGAFPLPGTVLFIAGAAVCAWTIKKIIDCWRTAYGLTNRRVIIATGPDGPTASYGAAALAGMVRSGNEVRGSIKFAYGDDNNSYSYKAALYGIRDPVRVEALIYQTLLREHEKGNPA